MTYREIFMLAHKIGKKAEYDALQMAKGKVKAPTDLRPDYGWAGIMGVKK